jgi:hypothetical protein
VREAMWESTSSEIVVYDILKSLPQINSGVAHQPLSDHQIAPGCDEPPHSEADDIL